jgi:adenylate cyclase
MGEILSLKHLLMKKSIRILFIVFSGVTLKAQTNLDSLYTVWQDEGQPDSIRFKAINNVVNGYLNSQPDSAFHFAQMHYDFAKKKSLKKEMSIALGSQGTSFYYRGLYPQALQYFKRYVSINEEVNNNNDAAKGQNGIAIIYAIQGQYTKSLSYFQKSLETFEILDDNSSIAGCLLHIGNIYNDKEDFPKALEYYQRSFDINEKFGYKAGLSNSLGALGTVYYNQENYPKALEFLLKSLLIAEELGNSRPIATVLLNIAAVLSDQGDYAKALEYYYKSISISEEVGDPYNITTAVTNIGLTFNQQGNHQKAIEECNKGLKIAEEIESILDQKYACECLYQAHKALGNGTDALKYHEEISKLDKVLNAEETAKKLQQMEFAKQVLADSLAQVEKDRLVEDAHQEEVSKKNKTRNMLAGAGLLVLLLAGGIYSRLRYVRKAKAIIEEEKDRSNNLLLNILPADIAEELKIHGKAEARDFDMVSILFTDFKGFTAASEKLSAQDLVAEINTCFEAFDGIMGKYNIEKIKTIGDAYMAAGGLPVPTDDSVKNTVLASLEMQAFISKRKIELDSKGLPAFEMRVGVHTGPVVAGIVGLKKFQYDIWGDTVNTASRMESAGEVAKVNISQTTYDLLKDDSDFEFESRGKIEAKGKGEIEMFFVSKA